MPLNGEEEQQLDAQIRGSVFGMDSTEIKHRGFRSAYHIILPFYEHQLQVIAKSVKR